MAIYYFLEDHFISSTLIQAGTFAATADVGGILPAFWRPTANVDPVDNAAVFAYQSEGPRPQGPIRQQWTDLPIVPPKYRWVGLVLTGPLAPPTAVFQLVSETGVPLTSDSGQPLVTP